tara:strand:- start:597 stop:818 length:222 start_codon:yes stop_codon:yes gene_type:complete
MKDRYEVMFELYGKKLKTTVIAKSGQEAKSIIMGKIIFHSVKLKGMPDTSNMDSDDMLNKFHDLFGDDNPLNS